MMVNNRMLPTTKYPAIIPEKSANTQAGAENLITEAKARSILNTVTGDVIRLARGTLVTPAAKDVFAHAKKTVELI